MFNETCYGEPGRSVTDWNDARKACLDLSEIFANFHLSFDLASIHSDKENEFVISAFITNPEHEFVMYGLKRNANEMEFYWSDGSQIDYENWKEGKPSRNVNKFIDKIKSLIFLHHEKFYSTIDLFLTQESLNACTSTTGGGWVDDSCTYNSDGGLYHCYYICKGTYAGNY